MYMHVHACSCMYVQEMFSGYTCKRKSVKGRQGQVFIRRNFSGDWSEFNSQVHNARGFPIIHSVCMYMNDLRSTGCGRLAYNNLYYL